MTKIITHGGQAHRDEFIACCLLLASRAFIAEIVRIPHSKFSFELQDDGDCVVDVGLLHEPDKLRFDHHQDTPAFGESRSAFARVAEDLLGWQPDLAKQVFPWYQLSSDMDCHGPRKVADSLGLVADQLMTTMSPVEDQLLQVFERDPNSLLTLMREMGASWMKYYNAYTAAEEIHKEAAVIVGVPDGPFTVLDLTRLDTDQQHNVVGLRMARRFNAAVIVSKDPTGAGLSLFRVDDHPDIDFSGLAGEEGILFAHANGYIAKTRATDVDWMTLIQQARVGESLSS